MKDDDAPEQTTEQLARFMPARVRRRLMAGGFASGDDVAALRRFIGLSQEDFALALCISVATLRNWEQGRRHPEGPAIALLRMAARHPRLLYESLGRTPGEGSAVSGSEGKPLAPPRRARRAASSG
jgi:DNA-binding transcriptional regulator YiaG